MTAVLPSHSHLHHPRHGILLNPSPSVSPFHHTVSLPLSTPPTPPSPPPPPPPPPTPTPNQTTSPPKIPPPAHAQSTPPPPSTTALSPKPAPAPTPTKPAPDQVLHPTAAASASLPSPSPAATTSPTPISPRLLRRRLPPRPRHRPLTQGVRPAQSPSSLLFDASTEASPPSVHTAPSSPLLLPAQSQSHSRPPSDISHDWDLLTPTSPHAPSEPLPEPPRKPCSSTGSSTGKWTNLFKPLLGRGKATMARSLSSEELSALQGLGMGKISSRSRSPSRTRDPECARDFGAPLDRWMSEGGGAAPPPTKKKRTSFFGGGGGSGGGVPLGRTQSLTLSLNGGEKEERGRGRHTKGSASASSSRAGSVIGGRKQTRMLNGRVYGARRNANANPFANVRTEEPEFVEWGYGGMGSVKGGGVGSSVWARVQTGNSSLMAKAAADEDDGGGMAWVKKRREQREKEKREREEREQEQQSQNSEQEQEREQEQEEEHEQAKAEGVRAEKAESGEQRIALEHPTSAQSTASPTPLTSPCPSSPAPHAHAEGAHITTAVTIPAPHHHHRHHSHHHHAHARGSVERMPSLPLPERGESVDTARGVPFAVPVVAVPVQEAAEPEQAPLQRMRGARRARKRALRAERSRRTALGAGVEKIARHKESGVDGAAPLS
ncbi:hypothetical protein A0H81_04839 [Grifola frondosa]|uniref:Uncharacterized protein n=1 Tax=Grifola frondosa TaxID=5627 RepID=A0A1C7MDY3_GRIFR|nr:hypothetical protein A0H81_04839 [Grifola frondosa]